MTQTRASLLREIHTDWPQIRAIAGTLPSRVPGIKLEILGDSAKIVKGTKLGILTRVVYLSPDNEAFIDKDRTICRDATEECSEVCLGANAGRMVFDAALNSRIWKTTLFMGWRAAFRILIDQEIKRHIKYARGLGFEPALRFDGSSDTGYGKQLAKMHHGCQFYDYTKSRARMRLWMEQQPANFHLTYSYNGKGRYWAFCKTVLGLGHNVAVVFNDRLPRTYRGYRVIDGDESDARFLDPAGRVVGLRFKCNTNREQGLVNAGRFVIA